MHFFHGFTVSGLFSYLLACEYQRNSAYRYKMMMKINEKRYSCMSLARYQAQPKHCRHTSTNHSWVPKHVNQSQFSTTVFLLLIRTV